MQKHIIIGITGAPGSGKTTVSKMLGKQLRIKIIDADKIAWKILEKPEVKKKLVKTFGNDIIFNGKISRQILASRAFSSAAGVKKLNSIMHPYILKEIKQKLKNNMIIDAPLLIETGLHKKCDYVIAVKCSKNFIEKRNKRYNIKERTKYHLPQKEKLKHADFVVDNNGIRAATRRQVKALMKFFR